MVSQAYYLTSVIPAFEKLWQEGCCKFDDSVTLSQKLITTTKRLANKINAS